jgi:hypothetical protein
MLKLTDILEIVEEINVKLSGILAVAESGVKLRCIAWTSCFVISV